MAWDAYLYDIERLENLLGYERQRRLIEVEYHDRWIAIAGGVIVAVASEGVDCAGEAARATPEAHHRLLFKVGAPLPPVAIDKADADQECKNAAECAANLINKVALGKLIRKAGGTLEDDYDHDRTCIELKGKKACWKWQGKGAMKGFEENGVYGFDQCIEITIDNLDPDKDKRKTKKICALLDTGKRGPFALLDAASFLDMAGTAEHPNDNEKGKTAGGDIPIRYGFVSVEIPQVDFSIGMAYVATDKDKLKAEVERRKKEQEGAEKDKKGEDKKKE